MMKKSGGMNNETAAGGQISGNIRRRRRSSCIFCSGKNQSDRRTYGLQWGACVSMRADGRNLRGGEKKG